MNKQAASTILSRLDTTANEVEALRDQGHINPREATELLRNIDGFSDKLEKATYGEKSLAARQAKVLKRDSDEPWMDTFENPQKPIETDPDEPYMHTAPGGFNSKDIPTYDSDDTYGVTERDEFAVRDLSEHADPTKQQPSWSRGPAGKSTKQGATRQASAKTWAP